MTSRKSKETGIQGKGRKGKKNARRPSPVFAICDSADFLAVPLSPVQAAIITSQKADIRIHESFTSWDATMTQERRRGKGRRK
jgi:hypothetical protein